MKLNSFEVALGSAPAQLIIFLPELFAFATAIKATEDEPPGLVNVPVIRPVLGEFNVFRFKDTASLAVVSVSISVTKFPVPVIDVAPPVTVNLMALNLLPEDCPPM